MSLPDLSYGIVAEDEFSRTFDRFDTSVREADRLIEDLQRSLDRMARQAETSGQRMARAGGAGNLTAGLTGVIDGAIAGLGVAGVVRLADATANLQVRNERTAEAFLLLSGSAENAQAKLDAIERASDGAISRIEGMQVANKAAALGFANTSQELERVTRFATVTGRLLGVDTVTALDNIAAATANLSFVRLDQMGVSASEVRVRFNELKNTMSESEAFLQATLEVGERTFSTLEGSSLTAASGVEQLKKELIDLRDRAADPIGVVVNVVARGATEFLQGDFAQTAIDYALPNQSRSDRLLEDIDAFFGARQRNIGVNLAQQSTDLDLARQALELYAQALESGIPINDQYAESLFRAADAGFTGPVNSEQRDQITRYIIALQSLIEQWGVVELAANAAGDAMFQAASGAPALGVTPGQFTIQRYRDNQLTDDIQTGIREEKQGNIRAQIDEQLRSTAAVNAAQFELSLATSDTASQIALYQGRLANLQEGTVEYINTQTQIARLQNRIAGDTERAGGRFVSTLSNLESAFDSAISSIAGIPGFGGRTQVTDTDLRLSEAGLYRDKPDEFLRRAEDLLLNGIARSDISRDFIEQAVAASTGFDVERLGTLANDLLFQLLEEEFTSARLFGTGFGQENIDSLLNQQAIAFGLQQQGQANLGKQFIESQLKGGALPGIFAQAGGFAGQLDEQLNNTGFANQVGSIFNRQLTSDDVLSQVQKAMPTIGNTLQTAILGDFEGRNIGLQLVLMLLSQMQSAEVEVTE